MNREMNAWENAGKGKSVDFSRACGWTYESYKQLKGNGKLMLAQSNSLKYKVLKYNSCTSS